MIRNIKEQDLEICTHILVEAYAKSPYNEEFFDDNAYKYILEKYNNCKKDSFVFVDDNLGILGFIFLRLSTWSNGPQAILEEIVVNPLNQNTGIGKELMKYAHDYLNSQGIKSVMLWAKNNDRLLNFYKKQDFFEAKDFVVMFKNSN